MRLGIKGKQVLGVTSIVGVVVVALSVMHFARLAAVRLDETRARAELLANAVYQRAREVIVEGADPYQALRDDGGLRTMLQSSLYANNVTFAAIVDPDGLTVVRDDPTLERQPLPAGGNLDDVVSRGALGQLVHIYSDEGQNLQYRQPLLLGSTEIGSIRIGVSTLLIRDELDDALQPAFYTAAIALIVSVFVASLLAQLMLRPIHVIRTGLTRLGRGEFGVRLDLKQDDEFGELGTFFNTVSAQVSADRSQMANLESAVEHLEDAVAIVNPTGDLLFVNPAMRMLLPQAAVGVPLSAVVPADHALRNLAEQTLASRRSRGPIPASFTMHGRSEQGERLILAHPVNDASGNLVGIMLIVRNLEYLSQVQSTVRYSRKLAALGRLSAGVAHEVKNPLNAMMIHLELLRQKFMPRAALAARSAAVAPGAVVAPRGAAVVTSEAPPLDAADALQHVDVIAAEIRRLDEVVQGFLKFSRPEDLKLQPVSLAGLFEEVIPIVRPEADRLKVRIVLECSNAPDVNGDPAMLRQAFLNLALNACQAMPNGGVLTMRCEAARRRGVAITFTDTGVGIKPEHLQKIFDLYFTTKERGSGIGLSMVYRTVQMHDGDIEVQSIPGKGTTFRLLLPQATA